MGIEQSKVYTQTYGGYFQPKFDNAITYNKETSNPTEASRTSYTNVTQKSSSTGQGGDSKSFQEIIDSDDFITYLLILQANPINIILQGQNITTYDFNMGTTGTVGSAQTKTSRANDSEGQQQTQQTGIYNIIRNLTGQKYNPETGEISTSGTAEIKSDEDLAVILDKQNNLDNVWCLGTDGRLYYKITKEGNDTNIKRGCKMFECLAEWFNALDNVQNQYIQYLFNVRNPTQSYIKMLVNQADLTYQTYSSEFNDIMEKRVKNLTLLDINKKQFIVMMQKPAEDQNIKLRLETNNYGSITKAALGNGTDIDVDSSLEDGMTITQLGYYAYSLQKIQLIDQQYFKKENYDKIWKCLYKGIWHVIIYGETYWSPDQPVYYLMPLSDFLRFCYNNQ